MPPLMKTDIIYIMFFFYPTIIYSKHWLRRDWHTPLSIKWTNLKFLLFVLKELDVSLVGDLLFICII